MINRNFITGSLLILLFIFFGCEDYSELDPPSLDPGELDPTTYVAIGNSLTAGLQSGALYASAQQYNYPSLIAQQMGVEEFEQPIFEDPGLPGRMRVSNLDPFEMVTDPPNMSPPVNADLQQPFHNLGIPGSIVFDIIDQADFEAKSVERGNPFFAYILRSQAFGETVLNQALNLQPTFLTLWTGSNDILSYVASGGTDTQTIQNRNITFTLAYQTIAQTLANANVPVVLANIPDVTDIPFVNTVPPVIINPATNQPITDPDGNPIFFIGVSPGDKLLLTALDLINQGYGIPTQLGGNNEALPDSVILSVSQQETTQDVVQEFNAVIASVADQHGFGLVDIYSAFNDIAQNGYMMGDQQLTFEYVTGGIFSLDGAHPTSRGQALIANEFISVINQKFNANIPHISVGTIPPSIEIAGNPGPMTMEKLLQIDTSIFADVLDLYRQ